MTVDSSMSSGYCSLEEELEDCFFTAKTTFFRSVQSKRPSSKCNDIRAFHGGKQALWSEETWLLADRLSTSYRSGGQLPCGPLELVDGANPGWIWSPLGPQAKLVFFLFNVLFSISCPRTFSKWLSRIWGPSAHHVPGRVTFPQIRL